MHNAIGKFIGEWIVLPRLSLSKAVAQLPQLPFLPVTPLQTQIVLVTMCPYSKIKPLAELNLFAVVIVQM